MGNGAVAEVYAVMVEQAMPTGDLEMVSGGQVIERMEFNFISIRCWPAVGRCYWKYLREILSSFLMISAG